MYRRKMVFIACLLMFFDNTAFADSSDSFQDPTQPTNYSADISKERTTESITSFVLYSVLISENNRLAVINNSIFKVGDRVGDEKVKSIDAYSVTLTGGEQGEVVLHLFGSSIKEPAK